MSGRHLSLLIVVRWGPTPTASALRQRGIYQWALALRSRPVLRSQARCGRRRAGLALAQGAAEFFSTLLVLVVALGACSEKVAREEQVVLEVADRPVTLGELDRFVQMSVQQKSPVLSPEVMAALFDQFVEEQLLLRAAEDAGIEAEPSAVAKKMAALRSFPVSDMNDLAADDAAVALNLEKQIRIEKLVSTQALKGVEVDEDEIVRYFESHQEKFVRPETADVSQILVASEELAKELRKEVMSGGRTFEDAAREYSRGPEASAGGRLGAFARGELPPSFEAEVFALAPGSTSEVVSTDFGFHIFRVNSRTVEEPLSLDAVRETVRVELLREKSDEAMKSYVAGLEKRYPVTVHHEHLSFATAGRRESKRDAIEENQKMERSQ